MRGTPCQRHHGRTGTGIIPAHAGNTFCEHMDGKVVGGSSPRMRGTPKTKRMICFITGIIPAHAGNTVRPRRRSGAPRDHPRACGEHLGLTSWMPAGSGSSPRMRGTQHYINAGLSPTGIIPAHAGNTETAARWRSGRRDHPRACGEHVFGLGAILVLWGSSPRMRGTLRVSSLSLSFPGIIPAHAGNTYSAVF